MVTARFLVGTSSDAAILRVHEKVRANMDRIPVGVPEPLIVGRGIDDVAILALTLSPKPDAADRITANDLTRIARELRTEVAKIHERRPDLPRRRDRRDDPHRPRPERLALYGVTLQQLAAKVSGANSRLPGRPGPRRRRADRRWSPARRCAAPTRSATCWSPPATTGRSTSATSPTSASPPKAATRWSRPSRWPTARRQRVPSVTLAIAKRAGSNAVTVAEAILHRVEGLHGSADPRRHHRRGHPQLRRDRQREGQRAPLPPRPRHDLDHRPGRLRHRPPRGLRGRDRHPGDDPADALRLLADGLHAEPRLALRADLLDRHPGRRRHRRDREHRPPLGAWPTAATAGRRRSRRWPRSATPPSSPPSPWSRRCCRCSSSPA